MGAAVFSINNGVLAGTDSWISSQLEYEIDSTHIVEKILVDRVDPFERNYQVSGNVMLPDVKTLTYDRATHTISATLDREEDYDIGG